MKKVSLIFLLISEITLAKEAKESRFMVDVGAGLPQLAGIDASYKLFSNWQIGMGYGLLPGGQEGIAPGVSLPSQNVKLANNQFVTFDKPTVRSIISSFTPFVRFYPNPSSFYFQLTIGLMQVKNNFSSEILDVSGNLISDASYNGIMTVTQMLPTLSIGHVFNSELFFFNVNMGVSIIATASVETVITSELPDRLGGNAGNQSTIDGLTANAQSAINAGVEEFRHQVLFLPSIQIAFGFMF